MKKVNICKNSAPPHCKSIFKVALNETQLDIMLLGFNRSILACSGRHSNLFADFPALACGASPFG